MEDAHRQTVHQNTAIDSINHSSAILSMMKQFHENEEYFDVQIQVDNKLFRCQRMILAANSEYFDTQFQSGNFGRSNATVSSDQILNLPKKGARSAFETILHFMYTGKIRGNHLNARSLLVLSDFLRLRNRRFKELVIELVRVRSRKMGPMTTALRLLRYACEKEENVLFDIMSAHVCRRLYYFSERPQLMQFRFEHLKALLRHSQKYIVAINGSADVLVKIVHNWVNFKRKVRSQYRLELMKNVSFDEVSSDFAFSLTNRLENALDEVLTLPRGVRSLSQLESLGAPLEVVRFGTAGLWGMISLNVPRLSEQPVGTKVFSPSPCMISNLLWKICFERRTLDDLDVYLCCYGTDLALEWNVYAEATFTIKSHKKGVENFSFSIAPGLFVSTDKIPSCWGEESFFPWSDLNDPEKGYVAENDSITIEAFVHADVPFISYDSCDD